MHRMVHSIGRLRFCLLYRSQNIKQEFSKVGKIIKIEVDGNTTLDPGLVSRFIRVFEPVSSYKLIFRIFVVFNYKCTRFRKISNNTREPEYVICSEPFFFHTLTLTIHDRCIEITKMKQKKDWCCYHFPREILTRVERRQNEV